MMKLTLSYPSKEEERRILDRMAATETQLAVQAVVSWKILPLLANLWMPSMLTQKSVIMWSNNCRHSPT